jgi:transglutaminase-like putative cysteine protease
MTQMRGFPIVPQGLQVEIPDGAEGTRETLKQMRDLVQRAKSDLYLRDLAARIVSDCTAKDWDGELEALFAFVQSRIRYTLDVHEMEVLQAPAQTLALGYGDCDDMAILLATLCELAGHATAFCAVGFDGAGDYSHVLIIASGAGESDWLALDPTEAEAPGWFPPGVTDVLLCPITAAAQRAIEGANV